LIINIVVCGECSEVRRFFICTRRFSLLFLAPSGPASRSCQVRRVARFRVRSSLDPSIRRW
jgi:hypothetical protein